MQSHRRQPGRQLAIHRDPQGNPVDPRTGLRVEKGIEITAKEIEDALTRTGLPDRVLSQKSHLDVTLGTISKWRREGRILERKWARLQELVEAVERGHTERLPPLPDPLGKFSTEALVDSLESRGWRVYLRKRRTAK